MGLKGAAGVGTNRRTAGREDRVDRRAAVGGGDGGGARRGRQQQEQGFGWGGGGGAPVNVNYHCIVHMLAHF